jgi:hypothetical protein
MPITANRSQPVWSPRLKTTGGRRLHVVVPIKPRLGVAKCLEFSRDVSEAIARTDRDLYATTFAKLGRERKILIDYLRNNRTNTSICAFSPRARPGAVVSMPLGWKNLNVSPARWTLITVPRRLQGLRADPWPNTGPQLRTSRTNRSLHSEVYKAVSQRLAAAPRLPIPFLMVHRPTVGRAPTGRRVPNLAGNGAAQQTATRGYLGVPIGWDRPAPPRSRRARCQNIPHLAWDFRPPRPKHSFRFPRKCSSSEQATEAKSDASWQGACWSR